MGHKPTIEQLNITYIYNHIHTKYICYSLVFAK